MILNPSLAAVAARSLLPSYVVPPGAPSVTQNASSTDSQWRLPQHAWDTHVHVFDPANYPYAAERLYTPETATFESLLAFNGNISMTQTPQNLVLVQPSPYGTYNSLVIDTLREHARKNQTSGQKLRAIVVIEENEVTDEQLSGWDDIGVRGFRVNVESSTTGIDYEELKRAMNETAHRVKKFDSWKCQLYVARETWDHIADTITDLPIAVIADHQGGMKGLSALPPNTTVTEQPGFKTLLSLAKTGKVFIKISGFYRSSNMTTGGYDDLEPLIKAFAKEVPQQLIWGSDWPHTSSANRTEENKYVPSKFRDVDNEAVLRNVRSWVGPQVWRSMMVDVPAKVYG